MNKVLNIFGSLLAIAWATTSCQEEIESVVPGASSSLTDKTVTVEFGAPCSTKGTLEVDDTPKTMTVAFYKKSSGSLAVKSPMTEGRRVTVSAANLDEDCTVYVMGNLSEYSAGDEVPWPSNESGLADFGINPINADCPLISDEEWTLGIGKLDVSGNRRAALKQIKLSPGNNGRKIKSIKLTGVPSKIYPFGSVSSGDETGDAATVSDINNYSEGNEISLYTPALSSSTKIIVEATVSNGDGTNQLETYTKSLTESNLKPGDINEFLNLRMFLDGAANSEENITYSATIEDTRRARFLNTPVIYGDGLDYGNTIRVDATNGDTGWTYYLAWPGSSNYEANAQIHVTQGNELVATKSLSESAGKITDLKPGVTYGIRVQSKGYFREAPKTINLEVRATPNNQYAQGVLIYSLPMKFVAPEVTITIPWAKAMNSTAKFHDQAIANQLSVLEISSDDPYGSPISTTWSKTGVKFKIRPGCSYEFEGQGSQSYVNYYIDGNDFYGCYTAKITADKMSGARITYTDLMGLGYTKTEASYKQITVTSKYTLTRSTDEPCHPFTASSNGETITIPWQSTDFSSLLGVGSGNQNIFLSGVEIGSFVPEFIQAQVRERDDETGSYKYIDATWSLSGVTFKIRSGYSYMLYGDLLAYHAYNGLYTLWGSNAIQNSYISYKDLKSKLSAKSIKINATSAEREYLYY